jgi:hypothetical protein
MACAWVMGPAPRAGEQLPQLAVARGIRHQKINVHRLAVFAMAQRDAGAAAKQAAVLAQRVAVQRAQHMRNALVVRALKLHRWPLAG